MQRYTGDDITILMSVYKKTIPEELLVSYKSITIDQTILPSKAVVIIDGTIPDDLEKSISQLEKIKEVDLTVIRMEKNVGLAMALESGIKEIRTELVVRMDSDDISIPERIETQLNEFNINPKLAVFGGSVLEFEKVISDGALIRQMPEEDKIIRTFSKYRSPFNHPTVMFKVNIVEKAGGYIPLGTFEDYFLWVRLLNQNNVEFKNTNDILVYMRAGTDMYARRASKGYMRNVIRLRWWMLRNNIINILEFIIGLVMNFFSIIMPVRIRKLLYGMMFRKKIRSKEG